LIRHAKPSSTSAADVIPEVREGAAAADAMSKYAARSFTRANIWAVTVVKVLLILSSLLLLLFS
jgi:hypothetical protein